MSLNVNKMTKDQLRQHILMLAMELTQLEKDNKELKEYWSIEIKTCNRYREKSDKLEEENKKLKEKLAFYKWKRKQNKFGGWYFTKKMPKEL